MRPRCRKWCRLPWLLVWLAVFNFSIVIYLVFSQHNLPSNSYNVHQATRKTGWNEVVLILREFEDFQNDVYATISRINEKAFSNVSIVVVSDQVPYPPLKLPKNVHLLTLNLKPEQSFSSSGPEKVIQKEYSIILPDSVELSDQNVINIMMETFKKQPQNIRAVVWPLESSSHLHCVSLDINLKEWTAKYFPTQESTCDSVAGGDMIIMLKTKDLFELSYPFQRPLPKSFFIQTALRGWKIAIGNKTVFPQHKKLFQDAHASWKHRTRQFSRLKALYKQLGIKRVIKEDGTEEWYGCNKDSNRCFGTVINDMPEYLFQDRWTPPCCLRALRITARHVFRILENNDVRYWLEGGSLLGASRHGDIIPWDYDVDIGIYLSDINKSFQLTSAQSGSFEDEDGFIWEKATEGEFYRVQYSQSNHLHVDIFPFYATSNGTMTKNTWIKSHRQDMPFPEKYLKPMSKLPFVGMQVPVPNNYRQFLEMKFGKGVIENPKYPNEKNAD